MQRSQAGGRDEYSKKRLNGIDDHVLYSQKEGFVRETKNREKENWM
jgi:hypothetical protein